MRPSARKGSTALLLLRCFELGISLDDLDQMNIGMLYDIFTEKANDNYEWPEEATLEDIMAM